MKKGKGFHSAGSLLRNGIIANYSENVKSVAEESGMDRADGFIGIRTVDQNGQLDLRRADHTDIDIGGIQRLEHFGGYSDVRLNARADDRNLGDVV